MNVITEIVLILVLIDAAVFMGRYIRRSKRTARLNEKQFDLSERLLQESQRCRLEQAKLAEELSLLRKGLLKQEEGSVPAS